MSDDSRRDRENIRSGTIDVGFKIAGLATELGFETGEYEVANVWVASHDEIEVDLREVNPEADQ